MKTKLLAISIMCVLAATFTGCATSRDMKMVQAEQRLLDEKITQALQDVQDSKAIATAARTTADAAKTAADSARTTADAAKLQAEDASARAENAEKAALERQMIAEEMAQRADAAFARSMRK